MNAFSAVLAPWLADYFLLSTLLLAVALVVGWRIGQPAQRLAVARPTLAALFLLIGMCALPGWSLVHLLNENAAVDNAREVSTLPPAPSIEQPPLQLTPMPLVETQPKPTVAPPALWATLFAWNTWLVSAYLCGCLLTIAWQAIGGVLARRLIRDARPAPLQLRTLLKNIGEDAKRLPELLVSARIQTPAAIGALRPTILLPQAMLNAQQDSLRPILAHELAHIRHGDLRTLAAVRVLMILLWPQPLYWLLRRQIRQDQETLADAAAADVTSRTDFAEQLVAWARVATASGGGTPRLASSVGLWESPSQLKQRIAILLDERVQVLRSCSQRWRAGTVVALMGLAVGLSFVSIWPTQTIVAKEQKSDKDAKQFSFGGTVEVMAIGTHDEDPPRWWDATGKPLETVPFHVEHADNISPIPNRKVVFSLGDLPRDVNVSWRVLPPGNSSSGRVVLEKPDDNRAYYVHIFDLKQNPKVLQLRVGVASGEWMTLATGLSSSHGIFGNSVIFSRAMLDHQGNALVIVSENSPDAAKRVVGIDRNGKYHTAERSGSFGAGPLNQSNWSFPGLLPEDLKTCELQARPYEWVEIDGLPVNPRGDKRAEKTPAVNLGNWALVETSPVLQPDINGEPEAPADVTIATPPADEGKQEPDVQWDVFASPSLPADGDERESSAEETGAERTTPEISDQEIGKIVRKFLRPLRETNKPNLIQGFCLDEKGQPLAGVPVQIISQRLDGSGDPAKPILTANTDSQGKFRFVDVMSIKDEFPNGIPEEHFQPKNAKVFTLIGRADGRVPGFESHLAVSIARRGQSMAWVMQPASTLRGRFTDQQGNPVAGAQVAAGLTGTWGGDHGVGMATTDANGEYIIDDLAAYNAAEAQRALEAFAKENPETFRVPFEFRDRPLLIKHPSFATKRTIIRHIPGKIDLQLVPGSVIEGKVKLAEGEAAAKSLAGSVVHLQRVVPPPKQRVRPPMISFQMEKTSVDETGHYQFQSLPAGKYDLTAEVKGWVTQGVESVEVAVGETATAPDILLTSGGRVRLQLIDDETGEPLQFEKPTKGYINPQQRPQRAVIFMFRDNIVEYSTEGTCEMQLPAGKYAFSVNIPMADRSYMGSVMPDDYKKWPTHEVVDGELLELSTRVRIQKLGLASLQVTTTAPSDQETEDDEAANSFIPVTPVAETEE